jgi:cytochrome b561|tara:strand:+ start:178 stop:750 length:573 start_codon:yes stop_codon:yes gene_type:complete
MNWRNSEARYGLIAAGLHWFIALFFLGNLGLGFYMIDLKLSDPNLFPLYQLHKSFGISIFLIVTLRLSWRFIDTPPALPKSMAWWEKMAASLTHLGLYTILVAMPLTGWIIVSASPINIPTLIFDTIPVPHIGFIATDPDKDQWLAVGQWAHWLLAWSAGAAVFLHAAAALRHHFILKDDILRRMLPWAS